MTQQPQSVTAPQLTSVAPSLASPRIFIPFLIVTLIWGSTWIVIKGQLGIVPPSWSVTYRFLVGGLVMLGVALFTRTSLRIGREGHIFALLLGIAQFVFNFNFVYRAEAHVTSGLVAVVFALLFVPNAILSYLFLGQKMTGRFMVGSSIAVAGIVLLFVNEVRGDTASQSETLIGVGFTLMGVLSASAANVMQATERARRFPMASMLGWSMLWGSAINASFAWATTGGPVVDPHIAYFLGIAYLGVIASAIAFSLYFRMIREIGPGKAAYSSVVIPVIAMGFSTAFEGYHWSVLAAAGSVIALAGMVVALSARSPSK
jgi:drug/metabolite transporter (DMT)-like permease